MRDTPEKQTALRNLAVPALVKALEDPWENDAYGADDERLLSPTGFVVRNAAANALKAIGTAEAFQGLREVRAPRKDWAPDKGWFGSGKFGRPD